MPKNLMQMVNDGIVLGDGGMFLEANWRGYDVPEIIGTNPQALQQIHRDFHNAGSQVLQALTWFTSSAELKARYGWQDRVEEINRTAIEAAKAASGGSAPARRSSTPPTQHPAPAPRPSGRSKSPSSFNLAPTF